MPVVRNDTHTWIISFDEDHWGPIQGCYNFQISILCFFMISTWYVAGISSLRPCLCSKVCPQREVHSPPRGKLHQVAVPYLEWSHATGCDPRSSHLVQLHCYNPSTSINQIFGHCSFWVQDFAICFLKWWIPSRHHDDTNGPLRWSKRPAYYD